MTYSVFQTARIQDNTSLDEIQCLILDSSRTSGLFSKTSQWTQHTDVQTHTHSDISVFSFTCTSWSALCEWKDAYHGRFICDHKHTQLGHGHRYISSMVCIMSIDLWLVSEVWPQFTALVKRYAWMWALSYLLPKANKVMCESWVNGRSSQPFCTPLYILYRYAPSNLLCQP